MKTVKVKRPKIARNYVDTGCGFPVTVQAVAMANTPLGEVPLIDYAELHAKTLYAVATAPRHLTGNEIRFVRQYANKTFAAFGEFFGVSHAAVIAWEKCGESVTRMSLANEFCVRLIALHLLGLSPEQTTDLLLKFLLHPKEAIGPEHTPIQVAISTDPATFGGRQNRERGSIRMKRKLA